MRGINFGISFCVEIINYGAYFHPHSVVGEIQGGIVILLGEGYQSAEQELLHIFLLELRGTNDKLGVIYK